MDYDHADGSLDRARDTVIDYLNTKSLKPVWILETHVHADHLSAAPYFKEKFGAPVAIGKNITKVQYTFGVIYNAERGLEKMAHNLITYLKMVEI